MAVRYLEHSDIESAAAGELRVTHTKEALVAHREALIARFGPEFTSLYGWASLGPDDHIRGFATIEERVEQAHWRLPYKIASRHVHANAQGILARLSTGEEAVLLTGPSNFGMSEPGQQAAISLNKITSVLVVAGEDITLDGLVTAKLLMRLTDETVNEFATAQRQLIEDERNRRKRRARRRNPSRAKR